MNRTMMYVALDVRQATTVVVRESSRRVITRAILPTEASALTELSAGARGRSSRAAQIPDYGARDCLKQDVRPADSHAGTQLTIGSSPNPKKRQAGPCGRISDRTMVRFTRPVRFASTSIGSELVHENDAESD